MTQKTKGDTPQYSENEINQLKKILLNDAKTNLFSDVTQEKLDTIKTNQDLATYTKTISVSCHTPNTRSNLYILIYGVPKENLPILAGIYEDYIAAAAILWRIGTRK